jgi:hypothetical protein
MRKVDSLLEIALDESEINSRDVSEAAQCENQRSDPQEMEMQMQKSSDVIEKTQSHRFSAT